jgi:DNA polymerase-1
MNRALSNYHGMLEGIEVLTKNFDDTKLITYLATNNAIENKLGLKEQSAEFTGNYAEDVKDTTKIPIGELLEYNLKDCCATEYVYTKHWQTLVNEHQKLCYDDIMKPSVKSILAMELHGMAINPIRVQEAKKELSDIVNSCLDFFKNNQHIQEVHYQLLKEKADKKTEAAKQKVYTIDDSVVRKDLEEFNPGSGKQIQYLLYDYFGLPVIELTDTKLPATGGKVLKKLINHTSNEDIVVIIEYLCDYSDANKILSTFIPPFENAQQIGDGSWRLYGNINLGGTKSLRPSSTAPNLLNLPSGSKFGKLIKKCFEPIHDWLFVGSDMDSLESKINALLTRDPNQMKVYEDLYDGHCIRAYYYFKEQMPKISLANVDDKCFVANVGGTDIRFKTGDTITYKNIKYSAEDFYEKITDT